MSDCTNYKSPKQLGLRICTSDVPCYDGSILECINLPSNPSLNDVIKSTDEAICNLIDLINNIEVPAAVIPQDDWVVIDETYPFITPVDFSGASPVPNGFTFDVAYKILSADHAIVKVNAEYDVTIVSQFTDNMAFRIYMDDILDANSNWLNGTNGRFQSNITYPSNPSTRNFGVPVTYWISGGEDNPAPFNSDFFKIKGRATISNGVIVAQMMYPSAPVGNYIFNIEFEIVCGIQHV